MNWYRLDREVAVDVGGTAWRPLEVELDKYDDERLNRVFVNSRHQLTIRDFQPDDVDSYFCMQYNRKVQKRLSKIAFRSSGAAGDGAAGAAAAWSGVKGNDMIDMVVHVDIELPKREVLVTKSGIGYPKPMPGRIDKGNNVEVLTEWEEWSECSTCGVPGDRRRRGSCFVRRFDKKRKSSPPHLDHALRFYPDGVPCQSSLLTSRDLHDIAKRVPEVEIERCEMECEGKERSGVFKHVSFFKGQKKIKKVKVDKKYFQRLEGDEMRMFCLGSHDDSAVQWTNGSEVVDALDLPAVTRGRVSVDAANALFFRSLLLSDAGVYRCSSGGHDRVRYTLAVKSRPEEQDVGRYLGYLGWVFLGDFVVFVVLFIVRHKQRLVQVKKKAEKKRVPVKPKLKVARDAEDSVSSSLSSSSATSGDSTD